MKEVMKKLDELGEAIKNSSCAVDRVANWQEERGLSKIDFNRKDEFTNLLEEIFEAMGYKKEGDKDIPRNMASHYVDAWLMHVRSPDDEIIVDGLFYLIVYSIGAMMKLGYSPSIVFQEGLKEIDSRGGRFDHSAGKWVKEVTGNEYKADFRKAKKEGVYD